MCWNFATLVFTKKFLCHFFFSGLPTETSVSDLASCRRKPHLSLELISWSSLTQLQHQEGKKSIFLKLKRSSLSTFFYRLFNKFKILKRKWLARYVAVLILRDKEINSPTNVTRSQIITRNIFPLCFSYDDSSCRLENDFLSRSD